MTAVKEMRRAAAELCWCWTMPVCVTGDGGYVSLCKYDPDISLTRHGVPEFYFTPIYLLAGNDLSFIKTEKLSL